MNGADGAKNRRASWTPSAPATARSTRAPPSRRSTSIRARQLEPKRLAERTDYIEQNMKEQQVQKAITQVTVHGWPGGGRPPASGG
eukprot:6440756-Alexandrium_andersonii.AAC.1